jgi:adenylate cyclase
MSIVGELKRRNVIRVAILYFVSSWLLLQASDVLSSILPVPDWTGAFVFMMLLIGLAPALIFAWVYEMTPEGLKRQKDVDREQSITPVTGRKINTVIVVLLVLAIGGMVADRLVPEDAAPVAVAGSGGAGSGQVDKASIAVLPFADLSEAGDQQYFTDGLSEELLNLLVRIDGLKVASRTSSFAYRATSLSIPEISDELGVAHVLEGSVRKSGDRIRITAQLIEAGTDRHLWSENFDRNLEDIFAIQDEIGNAIVNALKDELGILEEVSVSVKAATGNVSAYELYLEARELFIKRERIDDSIRLFNEAIALDPGFARAWEGLAAAHAVADDWLAGDGIDHYPLAVEAANKALAIDPGLSMAYAVLAQTGRNYEANYGYAFDQYNIAIANDPKNTTAILWKGIAMNDLGYFEEARRLLERCIQIDPGYLNCVHHLATTLLSQGDIDRALEVFEPTLDLNFHSMTEVMVQVYAQRGERTLAVSLAHAKLGLVGAPVALWVDALAAPAADHSAGLARLEDWMRRSNSRDALDAMPAIYLAFDAFDLYLESGSSASFTLWAPSAARFRQSEQFGAVIRNLGILDYWQAHGFPEFCRPVGADDFACDDPF